MVDRIAELRSEAEAAIAGASSTGDLEELRVRFLGRKAELPNLLRNVASLLELRQTRVAGIVGVWRKQRRGARTQ